MLNKKTFCLLLLITAISMCTGAFFEVLIEGSGKNELMKLLLSNFSSENTSNFLTIFKTSIYSQFKSWLILFLCPIIPILIFLCPFVCITKGLSIGFSSTMLVETFGLKGALYILITIMPHSIIQLPLFCFLSSASLEMSILIFKVYTNKNNRNRNINALQKSARHYLTIFGCSLIILFLTSLVEAFLKQFLL